MINLIKCHGSVSWSKYTDDLIRVNHDLENIISCGSKFDALQITNIEKLEEYIKNGNIKDLEPIAIERSNELNDFYNEYKNLFIINPEKTKFHHTVLDEYYYSMLRLLSYELEREQTVLIVFGFSFADEHISKLILRSLNNPFLQVYIFCFNEISEKQIKQNLGLKDETSKIEFISPTDTDPNFDFEHFNKVIFGGKSC